MYPAPPAPGAPTPAPQPPYGTAPWPAQAPAPTYRPLPPRPPLPPVPVTTVPRTKASGPGSRAVGIVAALGLITLAALLYAEREQAFDGPVLLTAAAVVVILCGAGIAIAGATGRTSGGLGAIAIITVLVAVPVGAATNFRFDGTDGFVGEGAYTPRTLEAAEDGYSWTFGDVVVDLTEIPAGDVEEIPLHMGAGDLRVIVPEGTALTAEVRLGAGDVQWLGERKVSGVGNGWQTFESPAVRDGAEPELTLEISMGAGELTVVEG